MISLKTINLPRLVRFFIEGNLDESEQQKINKILSAPENKQTSSYLSLLYSLNFDNAQQDLQSKFSEQRKPISDLDLKETNPINNFIKGVAEEQFEIILTEIVQLLKGSNEVLVLEDPSLISNASLIVSVIQNKCKLSTVDIVLSSLHLQEDLCSIILSAVVVCNDPECLLTVISALIQRSKQNLGITNEIRKIEKIIMGIAKFMCDECQMILIRELLLKEQVFSSVILQITRLLQDELYFLSQLVNSEKLNWLIREISIPNSASNAIITFMITDLIKNCIHNLKFNGSNKKKKLLKNNNSVKFQNNNKMEMETETINKDQKTSEEKEKINNIIIKEKINFNYISIDSEQDIGEDNDQDDEIKKDYSNDNDDDDDDDQIDLDLDIDLEDDEIDLKSNKSFSMVFSILCKVYYLFDYKISDNLVNELLSNLNSEIFLNSSRNCELIFSFLITHCYFFAKIEKEIVVSICKKLFFTQHIKDFLFLVALKFHNNNLKEVVKLIGQLLRLKEKQLYPRKERIGIKRKTDQRTQQLGLNITKKDLLEFGKMYVSEDLFSKNNLFQNYKQMFQIVEGLKSPSLEVIIESFNSKNSNHSNFNNTNISTNYDFVQSLFDDPSQYVGLWSLQSAYEILKVNFFKHFENFDITDWLVSQLNNVQFPLHPLLLIIIDRFCDLNQQGFYSEISEQVIQKIIDSRNSMLEINPQLVCIIYFLLTYETKRKNSKIERTPKYSKKLFNSLPLFQLLSWLKYKVIFKKNVHPSYLKIFHRLFTMCLNLFPHLFTIRNLLRLSNPKVKKKMINLSLTKQYLSIEKLISQNLNLNNTNNSINNNNFFNFGGKKDKNEDENFNIGILLNIENAIKNPLSTILFLDSLLQKPIEVLVKEAKLILKFLFQIISYNFNEKIKSLTKQRELHEFQKKIEIYFGKIWKILHQVIPQDVSIIVVNLFISISSSSSSSSILEENDNDNLNNLSNNNNNSNNNDSSSNNNNNTLKPSTSTSISTSISTTNVYSHDSLLNNPLLILNCFQQKKMLRYPILVEIVIEILSEFSEEFNYMLSEILFSKNKSNQESEKVKLATAICVQESLVFHKLIDVTLKNKKEWKSEKNNENEINYYLEINQSFECIFLFIHGLFIDESPLIKLVHFQMYPYEAFELTTKFIPSIHACFNWLPELFLQPQQEKVLFGIRLCGHLVKKFPTTQGLEVSAQIPAHVERLMSRNCTDKQIEIIIDSLVDVGTAFPMEFGAQIIDTINLVSNFDQSSKTEIQSKSVLHSQLLYGLEIFDLTENDFKEIDTWINKRSLNSFLKINPHSPRLIYKTEAKIDSRKESENINWKSKTLKDLELELDNYRINQLKNSPSWKVRKYLKIVTIQGNINKQQKYLKWKGSTSILKLRTFTNYLNRYSYVMNEDKSKFCKLCKKINNLDIIEDLDHFLWNCPAYENNRKIWISELKNINISHILKNNNISNIIDRKDSITLLALVENKSIWKSLKKLLNHNLGIRANKRN
ncbi:integrator complex subunit 2 [Anaeramoeba flamelloides]|uniref:Integrator complex subunit 2 n=1 Tax=Anaeramoeba flamelloides TaxID=1746091 RepID=A0ABQ8XE96_9EUKA|nr:integrator complex subunit 2 [Anaeramoeba flamelloides]